MRTILLLFLGVSASFAHYTWVAPVPGKIQVAHGDKFPHGDEAVNASQVKLWAIAASGARTEVKVAATKTTVEGSYAGGAQRFAFVQDRGTMSRTPKGVKPGGRDKNPTATESFALMRTGVYGAGAALGLELEIVASQQSGAWHLQLLRNGKPVAGESVKVLLQDQEEGTVVGKTGADGRVTYTPPAGAKIALFLAEVKEKAAAPLDSRTISTSTYLSW